MSHFRRILSPEVASPGVDYRLVGDANSRSITLVIPEGFRKSKVPDTFIESIEFGLGKGKKSSTIAVVTEGLGEEVRVLWDNFARLGLVAALCGAIYFRSARR
jgi:hypothetical protein